MKKSFLSILGVTAFALGIGLNLEYAFADYGIRSNSLSTFVLAQSGSSSGNDSSNGDSGDTTGTGDLGPAYPKMKNKTDKFTAWETKLEKTAEGFTIEFKRQCRTWYTYCVEGDTSDRCYQNLNKKENSCEPWVKN